LEPLNSRYNIVIVGGGACGLLTAIVAAKNSTNILLLEKNSRLAKKVSASGNGKCNITNRDISTKNYHSHNLRFVESILNRFDLFKLKNTLREVGIEIVCTPDGKFFPLSYEAKSVVQTLTSYATFLGVKIECSKEVKDIIKYQDIFKLTLDNYYLEAKKVVISSGTLAHTNIGVSSLGFDIAKKFSIKVYDQFASLVQVNSDQKGIKEASGVKVYAKVKLFVDNQNINSKEGDILFTNYGLSGLVILDLSRDISKAYYEKKSIFISVDLIPNMSLDKLKSMLKNRFRLKNIHDINTWLSSIIHTKLHSLIVPKGELNLKSINTIVHNIKNLKLDIDSPRDIKYAEVQAGGVSLDELDEKTLESKKVKNLYFGGELLDVDGDRGGYNLHFAFACGYTIGKHLS
jgi:predicted Rossmann fold flavoprotein